VKRAALFLLVALTANAAAGRFGRVNERCAGGRSSRGLLCDDLAFFEFAPASGAGMGAACACTTPTGAKGEALTSTRTGPATCSPLGLSTSGITNASLVECSTNLPRVEPSGGVLALRVEGARTNVLTRFIDYANATWADVATPTLTGAQVSPWTGTYANLAVQFDDNDAVAFEGRTQTVTVSAGVAHTMSCFVKAGTLATARLSLDGTTADFTGLSSTTWTLATVVDASSSGVAIAAQALNGSTAAATGTVIWGGCQVEAGAYATSMIPTVATGATRNADGDPTFSGVSLTALASTGCAAASIQPLATGGLQGGLVVMSSAGRAMYAVGDTIRMFDGTTEPTLAAGSASGVIKRYLNTWTGATQTLRNLTDSTNNTGAFDGTMDVTGPLKVGSDNAIIGAPSGYLVSRVQLDPDVSKCTP